MGIVKNILYSFSHKRFLPVFKNQSVFPYYHLVNNQTVPHIDQLYRFKNVDQFRRDMDLLTNNYRIIRPEEIFAGKVPSNGFLLTFDDGLHEIYSHIFPILKEKNIPAIFFVNPNFVDNEQML